MCFFSRSNLLQQLNCYQAHEALVELGSQISLEQSLKLISAFTFLNSDQLTFEDFCSLTSFTILKVHEELYLNSVPANWHEIVPACHAILVTAAVNVVVFYALKPAKVIDSNTKDVVASAPVKVEKGVNLLVPLVYDVQKSFTDNELDAIFVLCLIGWGMAFILSMRMRGFMSGRVMDVVSLSFGVAVVSFLVHYLNPWFAVFVPLASLVLAFVLWCTKDW